MLIWRDPLVFTLPLCAFKGYMLASLVCDTWLTANQSEPCILIDSHIFAWFVFSTVDDVRPVVTCPQDVTTIVIEGLPGTTVTFTEPVASDNSGTATISSITQQSNSFFSVGSTPVVVIATDPSGNTAQCTFNVIVQPGKDSILVKGEKITLNKTSFVGFAANQYNQQSFISQLSREAKYVFKVTHVALS